MPNLKTRKIEKIQTNNFFEEFYLHHNELPGTNEQKQIAIAFGIIMIKLNELIDAFNDLQTAFNQYLEEHKKDSKK